MIDKYTVSLRGVPEIKDETIITRLLPGYTVVTIEDHEATIKAAIKAKDEEIARLREALHALVGQVVQARDGFGIYRDSPSMNAVLAQAQAALAKEEDRCHAE